MTLIGSGLSAQLGFAPETTYGTFATPTRFLEISKEQLKAEVLKMRTRAITDRYQRASRIRTAVKAAAGTIDLDLMNVGHGLLLKYLIGQVSTAPAGANGVAAPSAAPVPTAQAGTTSYTAGWYGVAYTYKNAGGQETTASPVATVQLTAGQQISVAALTPLPTNAASVNYYLTASQASSAAALTATLGFVVNGTGTTQVLTAAGNATQPPATNGTGGGAFIHTITPDAAAMTGLSATVQVGRPDITGTVNPFNYLGGKVTDWKLSCELDKNLALQTTWDFKTAETTDALAVATLPASSVPLSFIDGTVTYGGTARNIRKLEIGSKNALNVNRRYLGNAKHEPIANGEWDLTGTLEMEFEGVSDYNAFIAGTQAQLVVTFAYGTIPGGSGLPYQLQITCPLIEYTGETPMVESSDVLKQPLPFKALYNGTNPAITVTYQTSDSTP